MYSMGIASLQAQISQNNQKIQNLESRISELKHLLTKLFDKQSAFNKESLKFSSLMSIEVANINNIRSFENMKTAKGLAESFDLVFTGPKAESVFDNYRKIENSFERKIDETEQEIKRAKREIGQLESDISSCKHEIARIQESERQEAARQAALKKH